MCGRKNLIAMGLLVLPLTNIGAVKMEREVLHSPTNLTVSQCGMKVDSIVTTSISSELELPAGAAGKLMNRP